jgi:hypothetical protein
MLMALLEARCFHVQYENYERGMQRRVFADYDLSASQEKLGDQQSAPLAKRTPRYCLIVDTVICSTPLFWLC